MLMNAIMFLCAVLDIQILYTYFRGMFHQKKETISRIGVYAAFIGTEILLYLVTLFASDLSGPLRITIQLGSSILTTLGLTFLYESSLRYSIIVTLCFQAYSCIAELVSGGLFTYFLSNQLQSMPEIGDLILLLISKFILLLLAAGTMLVWRRKELYYNLQYSLLLLLTPILSIVILITIAYPIASELYQSILYSTTCACLLILNVGNFYLIEKNMQLLQTEYQKQKLQQQIEFQASKYQQIAAAYRDTRRIVHDVKKHYFFMQDCIQKEQYLPIQNYLTEAINDLENSYNTVNTGHLVVDSLLNNYLSLAKEEHIRLETDLNILPNLIPTSDYDLCIILGNLFDNSIHACQKISSKQEKKISVHLLTTSKEFIIYIKNSMIEQQKDTKKKDTQNLYHGYGTENITQTVTKYLGTYLQIAENGYYEVTITIPIFEDNQSQKTS